MQKIENHKLEWKVEAKTVTRNSGYVPPSKSEKKVWNYDLFSWVSWVSHESLSIVNMRLLPTQSQTRRKVLKVAKSLAKNEKSWLARKLIDEKFHLIILHYKRTDTPHSRVASRLKMWHINKLWITPYLIILTTKTMIYQITFEKLFCIKINHQIL